MHIITFLWGFESHNLCIADKPNSHTVCYLKGTGHICLGVRGTISPTTSNQSWIKSRELSLKGHEGGKFLKSFGGNPQVNRQLRRSERGWKDSIRTDIKVIGEGAWSELI